MFLCTPVCAKREPFSRMALGEIRRRPTLPGRFQPSTISVLRLNFCVRDGNRWIPQAIVTGNIGLSRFRVSPSPLAPSKPHRSELPPPSDQDRFRRSFDILSHIPLASVLWFASLLSALSGFLHLHSPLSKLHSLLKIKPSTD